MNDGPFPLTLTDARGAPHTLAAPPRRIVSLVPSQTELLADLGLAAEVVGLTRFCVHPAGWKRGKPIVGGTKQVDVERIAGLRPELILANLEENTREMVEALDAVAPVFVTDVRDLAGALAMIRTVGRLAGRPAEAEALAEEIDARFAALPAFEPLRAAYLIWQEPLMSVGHDTFIHAMLARAGLVNVCGALARYPEIPEEELGTADVVLLSSEPFPFREKHRAALAARLPADTCVLLADGELVSWYGSRLLQTPAYLRRLRAEIAEHLSPTSLRSVR